jgi:hypothetical protein
MESCSENQVVREFHGSHLSTDSEQKRPMLIERFQATRIAHRGHADICDGWLYTEFSRNAHRSDAVAAIRFHMPLDSRFLIALQESSSSELDRRPLNLKAHLSVEQDRTEALFVTESEFARGSTLLR